MKKLLFLLLACFAQESFAALFFAYNFNQTPVEFKIKQVNCSNELIVTVPPMSKTFRTARTFSSETYKDFLESRKECGVLNIHYRTPQFENWLYVTNSGYDSLNEIAGSNETGDAFNGVFHIVIKGNDIRVQGNPPEGCIKLCSDCSYMCLEQ